MRKLVIPFLVAGLLAGCSVSHQEPDTTVIYKRDLYGLIFEWAAYREAAIVAYEKLHNVSRKEAELKIDSIVKDMKSEKFEDWYQKQSKQKKI